MDEADWKFWEAWLSLGNEATRTMCPECRQVLDVLHTRPPGMTFACRGCRPDLFAKEESR